MDLSYKSIDELTEQLSAKLADVIINILEDRGVLAGKNKRTEKNAYQKTEQLLYNYVGFKRIVDEKLKEIETIKEFGVPKRSKSIVQFGGSTGGTVQGIVLPEETVENAVQKIYASIVETMDAIEFIDKGMSALKMDPYYKILEMRYFEGRTQEDIALEFDCSQVTISKNQSRLVRELSMQLFPNQSIAEMMN